MIKPSLPDNESERLAALQRYQILDTAREPAFDDLALIASTLCGTPMGAVTLIDADRQWFKALCGNDTRHTPRDESFCGHAIVDPEALMVVEDAASDRRFHDNPAVLNAPYVRFYAGAPLLSSDGYALGTLCVFDTQPRQLTSAQADALWALARQVSRLLEMRRLAAKLTQMEEQRRGYEARLQHYQQQLEQSNAELRELSTTDALTGLANRRSLTLALGRLLEDGTAEVAVAIIDVDHFKRVNDAQGHAEGDRALVELAALFKRQAGPGELIARYGGEEFVFVMRGLSAEHAVARCERLRTAVAYMQLGYPVSVSIGVAAHAPGEAYGSVLQRADKALYRAKHEGRNRVVLAPPA